MLNRSVSDEKTLEILRHSTAHLLAHAVKKIFPTAQLTIGPTIEDGFYYDFYYPEGFHEEDLKRLEEKMHELAKANDPIVREEWQRAEALQYFQDIGETYKVKIINDLPGNETITVYRQGDFVDLCRGPHVERTGVLRAFALTKLSGAYWRGKAENETLQRVYGTAFSSKDELKAYLKRIEEAKLRDHRLLGKKMDLFHLQEEAPGMIFWHPNGWAINKEIRKYISAKWQEFGYEEVNTPIMLDRSLWEKSGHLGKFDEHMFMTSSENRDYAIKPMNCPGHIQIFKQGLKSYRDLPMRTAEFGCCHRNEYSGTLHGIMRVRGFWQDDGHIFCTEEQIFAESDRYIDQLFSVYKDFGFLDVGVKLATRPEKRVGADELWDKAEKALHDVLESKKIAWQLHPGEGAFYGPKLEFSLKDCLGRIWQCGTLQVDFSMPARLGAYYIAEDGSKKEPVMLHRAMLGSIERFIGILLEETAGNLPLWLMPVQTVVCNITDGQSEYVIKVKQDLEKLGVRVKSDLRNEKIGFKIREHTLQKVPYLVIIGDKEMQSGMIAVRKRDGKDLGVMSVEEFGKLLLNEIALK
ncbi:MAG: threonine--tRNA ligase [Gammaproteobacteria bacterium GWE2_37_16]|nr:MAG: threonine--tRNA ligase [Gammaproteobacteria bacterium GWE2_37_16]